MGSSSGAGDSSGGGSGGEGGEKDPSDATWREDFKRADVRHGRFTEAEKAALQKAVSEHAGAHGLSTQDYSWLTQRTGGRKGRPAVAAAGDKGPVAAVAAALPQRTRKAVFALLQRMFAGGERKVRARAPEWPAARWRRAWGGCKRGACVAAAHARRWGAAVGAKHWRVPDGLRGTWRGCIRPPLIC